MRQSPVKEVVCVMTIVPERFRRRLSSESGYRELLAMAFPLILSTGSWSIQHFVDRMFLAWYSPEAVAASMPAGILNFTLLCFFIGTASFAGTFVAQYYGAGRFERVGPSVWQGVYLSLVSGAVLLAVMPLSDDIFRFIGHDAAVQRYEVDYFRVLCLGGFPAVASSALSGFFIGMGRTWPVMWVNVLATAVNLALDYAMIFGRWGFPEMGVKGAALATVIAGVCNFVAYALLVMRPAYNRRFATMRGWRFDRELFGRLMRFGVPSGAQFFVDVSGFTIFLMLLGRLGTVNLAATNIAFNINTLAFMPMIGIGIAVSTMVGQNIGRSRSDLAEKAAYSGFHITFLYMGSVALLYVIAPGLFIAPFASGADPARFGEIASLTVVLLRFVAAYSLFDTMNIVFASAIKGAGDTRFVMIMLLTVSTLVLVIPVYVVIEVLGMGLYAGWLIATVYVCVLGVIFLLRFLGGKWREMRVIEEPAAALPPIQPEAPATEFEP